MKKLFNIWSEKREKSWGNMAPLFMSIFKWATSVTGIFCCQTIYVFLISDCKWLFIKCIAYFLLTGKEYKFSMFTTINLCSYRLQQNLF